jgi:hypothetical protein
MAGAREDSVLVSLRALKGISADREEEEREQQRLRAEQARQALAEAERLRREDAERIVREAEAARQRAADEAARVAREDALRREEAERHARIEAEALLEVARLRMEVEARGIKRPVKRPVGLLVALGLVACAALGLGVHAQRTGEARRAAARELRIAEEEAAKQRALVDVARKERDEKQRRMDEATREPAIVEPPPMDVRPPHPRRHVVVTTLPDAPLPLLICPEGKSLCKPEEMVRR